MLQFGAFFFYPGEHLISRQQLGKAPESWFIHTTGFHDSNEDADRKIDAQIFCIQRKKTEDQWKGKGSKTDNYSEQYCTCTVTGKINDYRLQ